MAKKMYYSEAEAAGKLGVTPEQLATQVREGKLRVFQSGGQKMYKADEVDALAGGGEEEIELAPAGDAVDLSKAAAPSSKPPGKEDTVITAAGISIFDDEELEIEPADPMAKTQIAPSLEEQISTEGVGSGSGLLDLTRESDDTSLGAEVLDHIDVEGGMGSSIAAAAAEEAPEAARPATIVVAAEAAPETVDAASGLFGGLVVACAVVAVAMGTVVAAAAQGLMPSYVQAMKDSLSLVLIAVVFLLAVGAVAGWMVGKGAAARQTAMRKMGA
jgi:hypothetical protein